MNTRAKLDADQMVFRKTNAKTGRHTVVSPANSPTQRLTYGRIILNPSQPRESFSTGEQETGLICLSGEADVNVDGRQTTLAQYDAIYVPRDSTVQITSRASADLAEFSAEVANRYPVQVVRFSQISQDPELKFSTGTAGCRRNLHMLLAKNIEAGRLIAGFTDSEPGNWTSWPPHEHAAMLEEIYVYFNMPQPAFGIQLVYQNTEHPELVTVVREGDAVLLPSGFHPNVAIPGHRICFLWAMAAHREVEDRQFGVVTVQQGFEQGPSGLEAGRKK
jgi:5-deoxy-glucuronate isomerase